MVRTPQITFQTIKDQTRQPFSIRELFVDLEFCLWISQDNLKRHELRCQNKKAYDCVRAKAGGEEVAKLELHLAPAASAVRYAILRAHPFGLAAVVLNFNRVPALASAVKRRCVGGCVTHYFDDTGILDLQSARGSAQEAVQVVYDSLGVILDPKKQQPMASQRAFLGVLLDLNAFLHQLQLRVDVKPGLREALAADIAEILKAKVCTSGQAAKLRGRFTWAASAMSGKRARGGTGPLVQRQYHDASTQISPQLAEALCYLRAMAMHVAPPQIDLKATRSNVSVLYTDASWEPKDMAAPGLGAVLLGQGANRTQGVAATVQACVLQAFQERETRIAPLEAFAVLWATLVFASDIEGQDMLLFVDNQSVCSALTRRGSPCPDIARLVCAWVDSHSNVSDGLSRGGVRDKWTCSRPWALRECPAPLWHMFQTVALQELPEVLQHWGREALGGG